MTGEEDLAQKTKSLHFNLVLSNILTSDEQEMFDLAFTTGIVIDPLVFKILIDLIRLDVSSSAIFAMLQSMAASTRNTTTTKRDMLRSGATVTQASQKKKPPLAAKPYRKDVKPSNR